MIRQTYLFLSIVAHSWKIPLQPFLLPTIFTFIGVVTTFFLFLRKHKRARLISEKEVIRLNKALSVLQTHIEKAKAEIEQLHQVQSKNEKEIWAKSIR